DSVRELVARIDCPALVIHGQDDAVRPHDSGLALAELIGGAFVSMAGAGHCPQARDPVKVNLLVRDFAERVQPPGPGWPGRGSRTWTRGRARGKGALYISSPIAPGNG